MYLNYLRLLKVYIVGSDPFCNLIKISQKWTFFISFVSNWKCRATVWTRKNFFGNLLGLNRYIFDGILYLLKQSLNIFWNKHCLRASRFKLKMRNWRKKVNIMLNWIKMKTMKKRYMYICTKKTMNDCKVMMFNLGTILGPYHI